MEAKGRVFKYGDNVDTDVLFQQDILIHLMPKN